MTQEKSLPGTSILDEIAGNRAAMQAQQIEQAELTVLTEAAERGETPSALVLQVAAEDFSGPEI